MKVEARAYVSAVRRDTVAHEARTNFHVVEVATDFDLKLVQGLRGDLLLQDAPVAVKKALLGMLGGRPVSTIKITLEVEEGEIR